MLNYIARRLALMVPTLFGILLISFVIVQFAPGGPVERIISQLTNPNSGASRARRRRRRRRLRRGNPASMDGAAKPIAARRASIPSSSRASRSSSASTSRRMSASS
jgi:ABC-type microcin C transport system permease subunit YejB